MLLCKVLCLGGDGCSVSRTSNIRNPHLLSNVNPAVLAGICMVPNK